MNNDINRQNERQGLIQWVRAYLPRLRVNRLFRKPVLFIRLGWAVMAARVFKSVKVRGIDFSFTPTCNLKCAHCYTTSFGTQDPDIVSPFLDLEQMKTILKKCTDAGVITYSFQGGEPLMFMARLKELIRVCKPYKSFIQIITNGTPATEEKLKELKACGLDGVCVSIDSFDADVHDRFRGVPGTYEKAMNCLELTRKLGLTASIATTVWKETVYKPELVNLFEYAEANDIGVQIFIGQMSGNWKEGKDKILGPDEIRWLDDLYRKNPGIKRDLYNNFTFTGCPAFKTSVYLTPKGEVIPCPFIHISFGNLLESSLDEIVRRAHRLDIFSDFNAAPVCLSAEDPEFIEKRLSMTFAKDKELPISYKEAFPELDDSGEKEK